MKNGTRDMLAESRWQAVQRHIVNGCEPFVYAVVTTGVYCRPGCSSRRPRRENVRFFDTPEEAERAGFRACKRCRPGTMDAGGPCRPGIQRACALIARSEEPPSVEELALISGLSTSWFRRVFKQALGVTPKQYASGVRRAKLQAALGEADSVTQAIYAAGFNSSSRVYEQTDDLLGMSPSTYSHGGAEQSIRYAMGDCFLGRLLVAVTDRGVCAIEFGDSDDELLEALRDRFGAAELAHDEYLRETLAGVVAFIRQPSSELGLPFDIQGTAFQQQVWSTLRSIPAGETRTYRQVAEALGKPGASRAVARACAQNRLAVAIPCHRVVGSNGRLTGYRWGAERKKALLAREAGEG